VNLMADFEISFISVRQMTFGSPTSKVQILFEVTGPKTGIDLVQVYAVNAVDTKSADLGNVVDAVDLSTTESQYSSLVDLQSGTAYTLALCPRSETGGVLDDQVEGQYWETFCIYQSFVTAANVSVPTPQIDIVSVAPRTLLHPNQITISWASIDYTDGQVLWGSQSGPRQNVYSFTPSDSGNVPNYTGQYAANIPDNLAGQMISFTVQVRNQFQDANLWSINTALVRAASNYRSLSQFLAASNIAPPTTIRQYLHGTSSLRALMGI